MKKIKQLDKKKSSSFSKKKTHQIRTQYRNLRNSITLKPKKKKKKKKHADSPFLIIKKLPISFFFFKYKKLPISWGSRIQSFSLFWTVRTQSFHLLALATNNGAHQRKPHWLDLSIREKLGFWPTSMAHLIPPMSSHPTQHGPTACFQTGLTHPSCFPGPTAFCATTTIYTK